MCSRGPTSATSSSGAARCPPAAAPPWAALRATTPVRCTTAALRRVLRCVRCRRHRGHKSAAGVIESCTTTGSVYGAHFIGGIAGENHASCQLHEHLQRQHDGGAERHRPFLADAERLIGTENAADITDIGGIAGQSGGVIRACMNAAPWLPAHGYNAAASRAARPATLRLRQLRHCLRPQGGRRHRRPDGAEQHAGIHKRTRCRSFPTR